MTRSLHTRRNFLKTIGWTAAAGMVTSAFGAVGAKHRAKIGMQLYTVRNAIQTGFDATMTKVAHMGYRGIETYALPDTVALDHASKMFRYLGLTVFSMHVDLPVGDKRDIAMKQADAYHCDRMVFAGWPEGEKYKDLDTLKRTMEQYNEVAAYMKSRGIRFGLHNHWWEFENHPYGEMPFYYLLKHASSDVFFEIDTYWAKTAGRDPAAILRDFGKRAPLLHIKDGPAIKGEKAYEQVPAGEGVMDFGAICKAGGENIEWMIVEFDEYSKDIFDGVQKSYTYLTSKGYAEGKI